MDQYQLKKCIAANPDAKLKDIVTELLYNEIVSLRIIPGTKLNVNQIAATLGISRTPVAEAVSALMDIGFVVPHDGINGSFVLDLNLRDMMDLYRVRSAIEGEAAAICAHTADDHTLRELEKLADAFKDSVLRRDVRGMKDTDMPFHKLIISSCLNPYVISCYEQLLPKLTMYQSTMTEFIARSSNETNPLLPSVTYNHIAVVSAIRMRMPEFARQAMTEHVESSLSFTSMSSTGEDPFLALSRHK